jgi:large subunit ribosomal protein L6
MSRVGEKPVEIPKEVSIKLEGNEISFKGPKGDMQIKIPNLVDVKVKNDKIIVKRKGDYERAKAIHGTYRALIANAIKGVNEGWIKTLELVGTGYRAQVAGSKLTLALGFSHPVEVEAPEGISFKVEKNDIEIGGVDRQLVGETAAKIRAIRPPEPYKGKGVRYKDEHVRRKPGKAAKAAGTAGGAA